jgi:hypothetical protein
MRSVYTAKHGAPNLRGKKTRLAACKCCMWQDFREDYRVKLAKKEIREAFKRT